MAPLFAVAQRQVKTGRLQTRTHPRSALYCNSVYAPAGGHVGNRKMRENAFADQARQLEHASDILHGLLTLPIDGKPSRVMPVSSLCSVR